MQTGAASPTVVKDALVRAIQQLWKEKKVPYLAFQMAIRVVVTEANIKTDSY